ncbi:C40 family peptidase [Mesonia aquimarina]|uniref:C40 family peptidase n=1 Tax=Mesonia aquimarina TaxID=1504967 RepID=UPI000EF5897B|nr:C40 family peptidase [Mesonia aquimarina]
MKKLLLLVLLTGFLASCGAPKNNTSGIEESSSYRYDPVPAASNIADYALSFEGTKYKYGGTTKRGMDCSGLIYVSFQKENIQLPRTSGAMSKEGRRLRVNEINVGDLLFFQTNKTRRVINHVGLVVQLAPGEVSFIHSTTSSGVIVSSLNNPYWNKAFVMARRVF